MSLTVSGNRATDKRHNYNWIYRPIGVEWHWSVNGVWPSRVLNVRWRHSFRHFSFRGRRDFKLKWQVEQIEAARRPIIGPGASVCRPLSADWSFFSVIDKHFWIILFRAIPYFLKNSVWFLGLLMVCDNFWGAATPFMGRRGRSATHSFGRQVPKYTPKRRLLFLRSGKDCVRGANKSVG